MNLTSRDGGSTDQAPLTDPPILACTTQIEPPKPSEGLEYTYARKPAAFDHERKDMAHIYEIGGSKEFGEEIARGDQVFLTAKQVSV